ncbi:MAG TPA: ATP-binding protein [Anaeromyxobacteraceae bacterium]|nr:ATP-binding protein [Anaeromyxobacteraceae bacterium]
MIADDPSSGEPGRPDEGAPPGGERRSVEEALRASEAKFRTAFFNAGIGIHLVDANGRVLEHNQVLSTMLGYSPEEMRGMHLRQLLDAPHTDGAEEALQEMVRGHRDAFTGERRYRGKDGRIRHAVVRATAVRDEQGAFQYCIAMVEDVTEKRALEAQLLFADRMSALGTLAAGVAHEINNPLAFILSNLTYALEELARTGTAPGEVVRALEEAREGSVRVREIVRDLKTFSRPEDRPDEEVDLPAVLRSAMNLAQNEIRHRAQLEADLRPVPPVSASAHRLGQVFLNLLINAAQAIPEGQADRHRIGVVCRAEGAQVVVEVSDTGVGIPEELLPRVFEPFFTTKPVGVGTGLGLSVCHGIVTAVGGDITVESRPGATTFRVLLPAADAPAPAAEEPPRPPARRTRVRVLVVDDEPMVARAIARTLSAHDVTVLHSGAAALERLRQDAGYDVVLCDLMMPEVNGMDLHERLLLEAPATSERLVFMTGGAFTSQAREFLARVPNARVDKPFEPAALRALVDGLVAVHR